MRIGGVPIKTYGYDPAGRTTSVQSAAGQTILAYDYEDRLISIGGGGVPATSYTYNGLDTRVTKTSGSTLTYKRDGAYVTDPVLKEGLAGFTPGISERRSGTTTYSHAGLKNNAVQTGASQTVTASKTYDAFGLLASSSGTWKGPFSYGGPFGYQEDTESGLKLLGHRYYDPSTGRFLTRDPLGDGNNWYVYCSNNPLAACDPNGLRRGRLRAPEEQVYEELVQLEVDGAIADAEAVLLAMAEARARQGLVYMIVLALLSSLAEHTDHPDDKSRPALFRAHDNGKHAREMGNYWTDKDPRHISDYRRRAGLPPQNEATHVTKAILLDFTGVRIGKAKDLQGNTIPDGVKEYFVPFPDAQMRKEWTKPFGPKIFDR